MTYEIYRYIFIGAAIAAGLFFITTIILMFVLRIPYVIGDLSGANARKAIQNIRLQNEQTGVKVYKSSAVNKERGQLTDKISSSGRLVARGNTSGFGMRTEKISTQILSQQAAETTLLSATANETTVLGTTMSHNVNETTVLNPVTLPNETTVLDVGMLGNVNETSLFVIEQEIMFIHTDEIAIA